MYALIILRHRKPPELLTIFRDRNDFVAAARPQESARAMASGDQGISRGV